MCKSCHVMHEFGHVALWSVYEVICLYFVRGTWSIPFCFFKSYDHARLNLFCLTFSILLCILNKATLCIIIIIKCGIHHRNHHR